MHGAAHLSVEDVADLLDVWASADMELADELDRLGAARALVSSRTVSRLERLLEGTLRPAVQARSLLAAVPVAVLREAVQRRRDRAMSAATGVPTRRGDC